MFAAKKYFWSVKHEQYHRNRAGAIRGDIYSYDGVSKDSPYVAVASAVIFVILGTVAAFKPELFGANFFALGSGETFSYTFKTAVGEIDWNVIMMIAGTMGTVYLFIESKMPQLMSDVLISKMPNVKWAVVCMSLFAGIVSAFVDNVATVLMIAPVALALCKKLNISPVPSIICIAVSSNLQGAGHACGRYDLYTARKSGESRFLRLLF